MRTNLFIDDQALNQMLEIKRVPQWYHLAWHMITHRGFRWEYFV